MGEITLFLGPDTDHNAVICYTVIYVKQIHSVREHREALKLYFSSPFILRFKQEKCLSMNVNIMKNKELLFSMIVVNMIKVLHSGEPQKQILK